MKKSEFFWNIFSPPRCIACDKNMSVRETAMFCYECGKSYGRIRPPVCIICGRHISENADTVCTTCKLNKHYIDSNVARYVYKGCVRDAIINMKFKSREWIGYSLGRALAETVTESYSDIAFDMVLYVPMTKLAEANRGFNQAYILAEEVAESLKLPVIHNILYKKIGTKTQSGLTRRERFENVRNAFFVCNPQKLTDKVVLLVDDVYTTGATLNECARMLRKAGALAVYTATIACTVAD